MHSALNELIHKPQLGSGVEMGKKRAFQASCLAARTDWTQRHTLVQTFRQPTLEQLLSLSASHRDRINNYYTLLTRFTHNIIIIILLLRLTAPLEDHTPHSIGQADIQFCLDSRVGIRNIVVPVHIPP